MKTPLAALLAAGALCCLAAAFLVAGREGLVVAGAALTALALVVLRALVPAAPPAPPRPGRRPPSDPGRDFPGYRRIRSALSWTNVSARHFDLTTRPLLQRLLAARIADRYGADAKRYPDRTRHLLGADLWPLLDPARPASSDGDAPGVDIDTLARVVDRLEAL